MVGWTKGKDAATSKGTQLVSQSTLVLLAFLGLFAPATIEVCAGTLEFPMTNDICPTSSFGSYRGGHLHGGMDFSTGGVTGVPVLAVDSCYVWRIKLWNGGYGKALYAQLPDGKVAVYGHLSRYRPELEARVEAEQDRLGFYEIELYFGPGEFNFAPGDTLAFSGDTGSGPPHLHFELRSSQGDHNKINPVPDYLDVSENLSPVIEKITIVPLSSQCAVNGIYGPVTLDRGQAADTLVVTRADFGVSVAAIDHAQCGKVITPIVYEVRLEGHPYWRFHLDTFPFSESYLVGALYDVFEGKRYMRLFQEYPLDLSRFGETTRNQLWNPMSLLVRDEPYRLLVRVEDAWGNADSVEVPVRVVRSSHTGWTGAEEIDSLPAAGLPQVKEEDIEIETIVHSGYVEVIARTSRYPESLPSTKMIGWGRSEAIPESLLPVGESLFRGVVSPFETFPEDLMVRLEVSFDFGETETTKSKSMVVGVARRGHGFTFSGKRFEIELLPPEEDLPRTLIEVKEDSTGVYERFESVAGRILLEPNGVFLHKGLKFRVRDLKGQVSAKHGVYADRDGWPVYLGRFNSAGVCEIRLRRLENLVILEDTEPPEITSIGRFRRRSDGKATFTARVADAGSGANAGSLKGFVDGDTAIVSIDPDTARITGRSRKPLKYGKHTIRLEAEDRLGNLAVKEVVLDLSR
jgi:murein DD-endopeptidase MepM/ murein hydrolase activator NlpD